MACTDPSGDATVADVREILYARPDLAALPDPPIELALDQARCVIGVQRFGRCTCKLQALYAAHVLYDGDGGGTAGAGPIASEADGPASRSFAVAYVVQPGDGYLATSPYGRQFLQLRKSCAGGRGSAIVGNTCIPQGG